MYSTTQETDLKPTVYHNTFIRKTITYKTLKPNPFPEYINVLMRFDIREAP